MPKKTTSIPVNSMADDFGGDISIEKISFSELHFFKEEKQSHRHDRHSFFLLESGTVHIDIDFKKHKVNAPSVVYMHPDQVHLITEFDNVTVSSWSINNESLNPDYLKLLEAITPTQPLALSEKTFPILSEAVSLIMKFSERKTDKLYHSLVKDSCNALIALVISQFLAADKPTDKLSRFDAVTKAFRDLLDHNYTTVKRPTDYAQQLNISTAYLNECVKNATGYSVSHHIQQRVVLEAKRLLYHSDKSVKEIAADLGYDDYPYFSRLFTKVAGMSALAFRNKNRD
jgi:AraC-like DNA-binding protein/mannose-6-phosphate isomerase-like protein (cupin superfamily)